MNAMSVEEVQAMKAINEKLASLKLKSRLSRLYISGISQATVTEWEWEKVFPEEGAKPSIIVSETIKKLVDHS
jgi:hypothetical protein